MWVSNENSRCKCLHLITVRLEWRHYTTPAARLPGLMLIKISYARLNSRTTLKSTWDMVRRTSGKYEANTVSHHKSNINDIMDEKEICNTLAEQFAFNSSSDDYSHMFNRYMLKLGKKDN